jgi:hypothetical protein
MYLTPRPEAERDFDGSQLTFSGSIPSSYGMDFIEVNLNDVSSGRALSVEFEGSGDVARFNVQVWGLRLGEARLRAVTPKPDIVPQNGDGVHVYVVQGPDAMAYDCLALIITRLDPDETMDPTGSYTITLGYQG